MLLLAWLAAIIIAILLIAIAVIFLNRFYRKSSRDMSLIRTGFGGQRIVISGGALALPFLHRIDEINMRTIRVDVRRINEKSLITEDRMRVDAEMEFYIRVQPSIDGVATAAQALGSKSLNSEGIRNLLEGRFVDAMQAIAASSSMDSLHERRAEFVRKVADLVRENLAQNGILLDSVSLTRMDQTAFSALDENNAFNAVGMRKLAEIIAVNKKKRAEIEADADTSVRQTQLEATKRRLTISQQEEQAQLAQRLEIDRSKAASDAESAKAREESLVASEGARINRERETKMLEIAKQRELRRIEIESQLNSEIRKVDSAIQLAGKHAEEARAQAQAELAKSEVILAQEKVQTDRERAVADRSREIAAKRVAEAGEVAEANAATEANVLLARTRSQAEATRTQAEAERLRMLAESEGSRALIAAKNSRSDALMAMELEQYRLDKMPEIVAQMVKPAEKIESIRIHQLSGFGGSHNGNAQGVNGGPNGNGNIVVDGNNKAPVAQVMDSILGMALQLPALKSIGEQIGYDFSSAMPKPKPKDPE
jgi:flotillin